MLDSLLAGLTGDKGGVPPLVAALMSLVSAAIGVIFGPYSKARVELWKDRQKEKDRKRDRAGLRAWDENKGPFYNWLGYSVNGHEQATFQSIDKLLDEIETGKYSHYPDKDIQEEWERVLELGSQALKARLLEMNGSADMDLILVKQYNDASSRFNSNVRKKYGDGS